MGGPYLGLVDIKLYVIDEYLRPAGGVGGDHTRNYNYNTTKPTSALQDKLKVILHIILT